MRKYSFVFSECPIEGCDRPFVNVFTMQSHFKDHIAWEKTHGCVVLFNDKGTVKAFCRKKA